MKEINNLKERFVINKLSKDEQVISFDCGDNDLNDFVINDAPKYLSSKLAVTYFKKLSRCQNLQARSKSKFERA